MAEYNIFGQPLETKPEEEPAAEVTEAAETGRTGEERKAPSRLAGKKRKLHPLALLALAAAILLPSGLSVMLGASLEQTRTELAHLQSSQDGPVIPVEEEPTVEGLQTQDRPGEGQDVVRGEDSGPELPAYQELYPELYAQPAKHNSIDADKVCYLTFDDGPSARTPEILEVLERYHVKATFFVVGKNSEQSKQWMRDIVAAGHTLAVHSYTHDYNKIYDSVEAYLEDFSKMYNLILEATGTAPQIFRFPGGSINAYNGDIYQEIVSEMVRRGFVYYDWNRTNGDAVRKSPSASVLAQNALNKAGSARRAIVLMHDSKSHVNTVKALPAIIEGYQAEGFTFDALTPEVRPIVYAYPK